MSRNSTKHITSKATRRVRSLRIKTVIDNSDTPIPSAPIITDQKAGGRNKLVAVNGRKSVPWQKLEAKREPFAWKAFRRAISPTPTAMMYGYEWIWFLRGWKARTRNQPIKGLIQQLRFWGDPRV